MNQKISSFFNYLHRLYSFLAEFLVYTQWTYSVLDFDILGKQIMDYVHHSNKTSERRPIISLSEAVPLHPTHSGKLEKKSIFSGRFAFSSSNEFESCKFAQRLSLIQREGRWKSLNKVQGVTFLTLLLNNSYKCRTSFLRHRCLGGSIYTAEKCHFI